ncbi:PA2928 family protein [Arenimonas caeni]|uniref:PA2928 family protein n=1 Tax=Arenimonas caeni TaxID=2058085 RepID=UPI0013B06414|nr:PA2928 family protein [Arenimonas caeni]
MGWERGRLGALVLAGLLLAGCNDTVHDELQVQGPIGLVQAGDQQQLWVLHKQRMEHTVRFGGRGRGNSFYTRRDTYFHFDVQAFDPATVRPVWQQRVVTYSDPELKPGQRTPSRIVGSTVSGRLLGQDADLVWLLVAHLPYALDAATGEIVHDAASIERARPELAGLLPSEARFWGFDEGLVTTLADGRRIRLTGRGLELADYAPRQRAIEPVPMRPDGTLRIVPARPTVPIVRHVPRGANEWLGLYTDKEAADAASDDTGEHARYPYSIADEGPMARRSFRHVRLAPATRWDETFLQVAAVEPVPGSPVLLRGRFVRDAATDAALDPGNGDLLAWHRTRIDDAGRLALSRLGPDLQPRWQLELPFTDGGGELQVLTWRIGQQLVVHGQAQTTQVDARLRVPHLVSVSLDEGRFAAWNLEAGAPPGEPPAFPRND